jgi:hypothetical protein
VFTTIPRRLDRDGIDQTPETGLARVDPNPNGEIVTASASSPAREKLTTRATAVLDGSRAEHSAFCVIVVVDGKIEESPLRRRQSFCLEGHRTPR